MADAAGLGACQAPGCLPGAHALPVWCPGWLRTAAVSYEFSMEKSNNRITEEGGLPMEFMAGYYRQREGCMALLLQHYICGGVPICLGCACGGDSSGAEAAGGLFTGRLLGEFRGLSLREAVRKPERALRKMERAVYRCRENCPAPRDFRMAGILCVGESFLLFFQGGMRILLCNTGFGRPALREIGETGKAEPELRRGIMETGIGILLASDSFCESLPPESLQGCLSVRDIRDPRQTQKRVRELGSAAEERGGRNMAAILLEVR